MEPVGVVAGAVVESPALHAVGHAVGELAAQRLSVVNGFDKRVVSLLGEILEHALTVEYLLSVISLYSFLGKIDLHSLAGCRFLNTFESEI